MSGTPSRRRERPEADIRPIFTGMLASSRVDCIRIARCIVIRFLIATLALLEAAHAQTPSRCPELMQLNTDAEASLGKADGLTGQDRCDASMG